MTDTQWPRFVVLHQARLDEPFQYAGSVHAPDAEIALLNARDVFTRRPECSGLWVVPASAIYSKTAEELTEERLQEAQVTASESYEEYTVFQKLAHKGVHTYAGTINGSSSEEALESALQQFTTKDVMVWWVFPSRAILRSTQQDIEMLFQMSEDRFYRDQGFFHTVATMRKITGHRAEEKDRD
jgi:ring-1,2-phenylacetyl-CoA epoxidase subunit PaaB